MKALLFIFWASLAFTLETSASTTESELPIVATTNYRYLGIYPIFEAELAMEPENYQRDALGNVSKSLHFTYSRNISSEKLVAAADKILKHNNSQDSLGSISEHLSKINAAYLDVKKNDRYTLKYSPASGTSLLLNGDHLVNIEGEDFHRIYFSIWLSPESPFDFKRVN